MKQKIIKAGPHSLAVVIPAGFIHALGIKKSDLVEVKTLQEKGEVRLKFKGSLQQLPLPESNVTNKSKPHRHTDPPAILPTGTRSAGRQGSKR